MKEDVERMVKAYLEVYGDFKKIYTEVPDEAAWVDEPFSTEETAILFQTALNDSLIGEMLKQEIIERYAQLKEEEQAKQAEVEVPG